MSRHVAHRSGPSRADEPTRTRRAIERAVGGFLRTIERRHGIAARAPDLHDAFLRFFARPGKRIRPVLFVAAATAYGMPLTPRLLRCSLSLELLHAFVLIHDDLIDRAPTRRGGPSMHRMLAPAAAPAVGANRAMLAGDLLFAVALRALLDAPGRPADRERALAVVLEAGVATATGAYNELRYDAAWLSGAGRDELLELMTLKTAEYSFVCPLVAGAALAGAPCEECAALASAGRAAGVAFQARDDLDDFESTDGGASADPLRASLPLWHALRLADPEGVRMLRSLSGSERLDARRLAAVAEVVRASGARAATERDVDEHLARAGAELSRVSIARQRREALEGYLRSVVDRRGR